MKKITKLFISLITVLLVMSGTSVLASNGFYISADIAYDKTDHTKNILKVTAEVDSSVSYVTLYVTDSSVNESDIGILSDISKIKIADAFRTNEGKIDVSYNLGEYLAYNNYNVYIFTGSDSFCHTGFTYLNPDDKLERDRQNILTALKTASDWKTFREVFFGVDTSGNTVNDNLEYINPDMDSYYNKITSSTDKANVFMRMYSKRKTLSGFADIAVSFITESKYMYENPTRQQGAGGASGSSSSIGGGSSPSFSTDAADIQKPNADTYTDMKGHWAQDYVSKLSEMNIISGYTDGTYRPENNVTRAEFVKLVSTAFSLPDNGGVKFDDVSDSDWFAPYIAGAASLGVVNGSDNMFRPNEYITRQDAALILYRAIALTHTLEDGNVFFTDEKEIASYASVAIRSLAQRKIITGMTDGSFMPKANTTRAQAATLILKAVDFASIH